MIDLRAPDDERLFVAARGGDGVVQVVRDNRAGGLEVALACHHDRSPSREQTPDRFEGLPSHDDVMAHRQLLETLQVSRQVPRQTALASDYSTAVHGDDQGGSHVVAEPQRGRNDE